MPIDDSARPEPLFIPKNRTLGLDAWRNSYTSANSTPTGVLSSAKRKTLCFDGVTYIFDVGERHTPKNNTHRQYTSPTRPQRKPRHNILPSTTRATTRGLLVNNESFM
eukprot:NODE_3206_length_1258_cov_124.543612_g3043_i0.p2 GENE.NODE_3206_length_1258_cov_124.543612_g3043_i0~~NODE_3206_length_1258_cov_124.543612_g3043_i0.p2  ORF type:complete len:108 (+),score=5.43 NODE_3206_length_1258_cov_124.543612_g3043_i0:86-409(+)